jgi:hypothetical protein
VQPVVNEEAYAYPALDAEPEVVRRELERIL